MAQKTWEMVFFFFIFHVLIQNCLVTSKWKLLEWFVCLLIKGCLNVVLSKHRVISKIKNQIQFFKVILAGGFFIYKKLIWSQYFEKSHEISYEGQFYEFQKHKDCLLVSCITHIEVQSFIPLYLSNHRGQYNPKLLLSQKYILISKQ